MRRSWACFLDGAWQWRFPTKDNCRLLQGQFVLNRDRTLRYVDPTHPGFLRGTGTEYPTMLANYLRDRGYQGFRLADETVVLDRGAIVGARKVSAAERQEIERRPRKHKRSSYGSLYSEMPWQGAPAPGSSFTLDLRKVRRGVGSYLVNGIPYELAEDPDQDLMALRIAAVLLRTHERDGGGVDAGRTPEALREAVLHVATAPSRQGDIRVSGSGAVSCDLLIAKRR